MDIIKKNLTLVFGIAIPVLMILFIAGSIYLPGIFIKPQFNFLYVSGDDYDYNYNRQQYLVQNGKLVKNEIIQPANQTYQPPRPEPKLYLYDVAKNQSRETSFEEARGMDLDSNVLSPDDFEIVYGSQGDGFFPFFFGSERDYGTRYLKGHNFSKKLNLQVNGNSYYNNFRFLGWIK